MTSRVGVFIYIKRGEEVKIYKIIISNRIDLYISNDGFRFTNSLLKPKTLYDWSSWAASWQVYESDGIRKKLYTFLDSLPEKFKCEKFYQGITFDNY